MRRAAEYQLEISDRDVGWGVDAVDVASVAATAADRNSYRTCYCNSSRVISSCGVSAVLAGGWRLHFENVYFADSRPN